MPRTDRASRVIPAAPERVFQALVDREALVKWLPPEGMSGSFERFDARPGGSYRLVLTYANASNSPGKATADSDIVEVRFVDIVPAARLVQAVDFVSDDPAFAGRMTMTWELSAASTGRGWISVLMTCQSASPPTITPPDCGPRWSTSPATSPSSEGGLEISRPLLRMTRGSREKRPHGHLQILLRSGAIHRSWPIEIRTRPPAELIARS